MKICPRCGSSMLIDFVDTYEGAGQVWRCLGCGREARLNLMDQLDEELDLQRVQAGIAGHKPRPFTRDPAH